MNSTTFSNLVKHGGGMKKKGKKRGKPGKVWDKWTTNKSTPT